MDAADFPRETYWRATAWRMALQDARSCLEASEYFEDKWQRNPRDDWHEVDGGGFAPSAVAADKLTDHAIVLYGQVFNIGYGGTGISSNQAKTVQRLRDEMLDDARTRLGRDKVDSIHKEVMRLRNQLVAHYAGEAANVRCDGDGTGSIRMVGAQLLGDDRRAFGELVTTLCRFIKERLFRAVQVNGHLWYRC